MPKGIGIIAAVVGAATQQPEIDTSLKKLEGVCNQRQQFCESLAKKPLYEQLKSDTTWQQLSSQVTELYTEITNKKLNAAEKSQFKKLKETIALQDQAMELAKKAI